MDWPHEWYGNLYLRRRGSDFCPIGVASGSETMRSQKTELACLVEVSCKRAPWFENLFRNPQEKKRTWRSAFIQVGVRARTFLFRAGEERPVEWDCCLYIIVLQHRYDSKDSHLVLGIFYP